MPTRRFRRSHASSLGVILAMSLVLIATGCAHRHGQDVLAAEFASARGDFVEASIHYRAALEEHAQSSVADKSREVATLGLVHAKLCAATQLRNSELAHSAVQVLEEYQAELAAHDPSVAASPPRALRSVQRDVRHAFDDSRLWSSIRCRPIGAQNVWAPQFQRSLDIAYGVWIYDADQRNVHRLYDPWR